MISYREKSLDNFTYNSSLWLDEWPVGSVHLVVEATGVAQVVPIAVTTPQRGRGCTAVHAFPAILN